MNEERMLILGNRLKLIRAESKLKQKEFAAQFGIAPTTYSGYESGRHEPTIDFLIQVADTYGLSLDYVVGRSSAKSGVLEDEIQKEFDENVIEPFRQNGMSELEIMKQVYANVKSNVNEALKQLGQMEQMIADKESENQ